jgi:uncharacterized protein with HEPN domain
MRDDRERLSDILEAIERIERYAGRGEHSFRTDELIQCWITTNLQVIGEAARTLEQGFRDEHSEVPWPDIVGMRHILVHHYFEIDLDIVWQVVTRDLPQLKSHIQNIVDTLNGET